MENRIKDYSISGNSIILPRKTGIEDIRLIYNETQKILICSTATKDNVSLAQGEGGTLVEVPTSVCSLNSTDLLTIKCDYGDNLEEVKEAVENIDFTDLENSIAEVKNAVANIDFSALAKEDTLTQGISSVESKVEEESQSIKDKIDHIKLPEIDTTNIASKDLERFFGVKPIEGYEFMTPEEICAELEEIMTSMDISLTPEMAATITNNTLNEQ